MKYWPLPFKRFCRQVKKKKKKALTGQSYWVKCHKILVLEGILMISVANPATSRGRASRETCSVARGHAVSNTKAGTRGHRHTFPSTPHPVKFLPMQIPGFSVIDLLLLPPGNSGGHGILSWFNGFKYYFLTRERSTSAFMEKVSLITCPFPEHGFEKPPGHWLQSDP